MKLFLSAIFILFFSFITFGQTDTCIVFLGDIDSTISTDVRYATANNFTGQVLYPSSKVFLRKVAAVKLSDAQKYLVENYNLRIKVYDGYRPPSVQWRMWEVYPDPNFVADPRKGSKHNRGAAVDLTLIDSLGFELDMGTPFDDFTEKAGYFSQDVSETAKENRRILRETMIKFDFTPYDGEWWHFDHKDWKTFSIIEVDIN